MILSSCDFEYFDLCTNVCLGLSGRSALTCVWGCLAEAHEEHVHTADGGAAAERGGRQDERGHQLLRPPRQVVPG